MSRSSLFCVSEPSHVAACRREAVMLAQELGFNETTTGKISIVITEAATNLLKHAGSGSVILRRVDAGGLNGLEVLALDKGPGMANVAKCMEDGYSTAGSPGTGLGAVFRLADLTDIYSLPGQGTVLLARFLTKPRKRSHQAAATLEIGAVCVPVTPGEACGDAWSMRHSGEVTQILLVDGLGHGLPAAKAADQALLTFQELPAQSPADMIRGLHGPLRATRGASLAIAELQHSARQLRYAGVGNIAGTILTGESTRSLVSHNGTVGHELHRISEFNYPWSPDCTLVLHSDGLMTRWNLQAYPGLIARHPSILAAVLFRDFQRPKDDSSVLVLRYAKEEL